MCSGLSPFLRTKFWKKELVGSGGVSLGEKKVCGEGRTVELVSGKVYAWRWLMVMVSGIKTIAIMVMHCQRRIDLLMVS